MMEHLIIFSVVLPMLGAPICILFKNSGKAWLFSVVVTFLTLLSVSQLYLQVFNTGTVHYYLGGWEPPYGIEYVADKLNATVALVVSVVAFLVSIYAYPSTKNDIAEPSQSAFYTLFLLCFAGLQGITLTNDIFNLYVFLEISSLATYALIAKGSDKRALTASFEYLILGTIGATFLLIGVGLLYVTTGTLNITDISLRLYEIQSERAVQAAFAFIILGLGLKIALVPLHGWLTNAYAYAPNVSSVFLAATATKVSVYALIRLLSMFGWDFSFDRMELDVTLPILAVAGIVVGSITACFQLHLKRLLAFSSVAQIGYIALGIGLATEAALAAGITHIVNHALAKAALFMAVGCMVLRTGSPRIEHIYGIGQYMPYTMMAFVIGGLSLIGVPLTAGFVTKWALFNALLDTKLWWLVIVLAISSLLAVIYIWRVVEAAYFKERPSHFGPVKEAPLIMLVPLWVMVIANIYMGLDTELSLTAAREIAAELMGGVR